MVIGLVGWLPRRPAVMGVGLLSGFLIIISAAAPFVWIQPAYRPPERQVPDNLQIVNADFEDKIRLVGYELEKGEVRPGESIEVILVWEVLAPMERNWSVFVHLNDPVLETPVAQRDMYLGQGLLAATFLKPGQQIINYYRLSLPPPAVAPAELTLVTGLYDYYSAAGERLRTAGGADSAALDTVLVVPAPGEAPNPVSINFENLVELIGYDVVPRRAQAGETFDVTLYFRPLRPLAQNYTVFAQVIDQDTTRWASDDQLQPTGEWPVGEVRSVHLSLTLDETTPADVYPIIVGLYIQTAEGSFDRLQTMTAEGRLTDDFLLLTSVRVD
jgi:hypothetical protein